MQLNGGRRREGGNCVARNYRDVFLVRGARQVAFHQTVRSPLFVPFSPNRRLRAQRGRHEELLVLAELPHDLVFAFKAAVLQQVHLDSSEGALSANWLSDN